MAFPIPAYDAIEGLHGGLFVNRMRGQRHPRRRIDCHELLLVRSGVLGMEEAGIPFRAQAGQALLLLAGREHGGNADYTPDLSFYWLHFRTRRGAVLVQAPQLSTPRRPDLLQAMAHRYIEDHVAKAHTPATAGLAVHAMLAELAAAPAAAAGATATPLIGQADAWIGQHYHEGISTSEVAAALGHNPDYLGRIYRRCTGRTLVAAITERRMAEAGRRLLHTTAAVADIARAVGFNDLAHFRRQFRRMHACSPQEFRTRHNRIYVNSD